MTETLYVKRSDRDAPDEPNFVKYVQATEADLRAAGYVPALEADTVSRAGPSDQDVGTAAWGEAWMRRCRVAESQLTALQAEHERVSVVRAELGERVATERARAEEVERLERVARGVLRRQADQLAAANARAGRLEEERAKLLDAFTRRECNDLTVEEFDGMFHEMLTPGQGMSVAVSKQNARTLSTAPQASTEPCLHRVNSLGHCMRCGARPYDKPIVQASTEQASPSPAVGEEFTSETERYLVGLMREVCDELGFHEEKDERAPILEALNKAHNYGAQNAAANFAKRGLLRGEPAQPAPGGTERWAKVTRRTRPEMVLDDPTPAEPQGWLAEGLREAANASPEMKAHVAAHPSGFLPEPQGRPEQAKDRVDQLRADIISALREWAADTWGNQMEQLMQVVNRLEGK